MMSNGLSFFGKRDSAKVERETILFDPSGLKAFVNAPRRASSSVEKAQSDSNSERDVSAHAQPQLSKSK